MSEAAASVFVEESDQRAGEDAGNQGKLKEANGKSSASSSTSSGTSVTVKHVSKAEMDKEWPFDLIKKNIYKKGGNSRSRSREKFVCECRLDPSDPDSACGEGCLNKMLMIECERKRYALAFPVPGCWSFANLTSPLLWVMLRERTERASSYVALYVHVMLVDSGQRALFPALVMLHPSIRALEEYWRRFGCWPWGFAYVLVTLAFSALVLVCDAAVLQLPMWVKVSQPALAAPAILQGRGVSDGTQGQGPQGPGTDPRVSGHVFVQVVHAQVCIH